MIPNDDRDLTPLKFFGSDEVRMRVAHQRFGSKLSFTEFYAEHLAKLEQQKHDPYAHWRGQPAFDITKAVHLVKLTLRAVRMVGQRLSSFMKRS